MGERAVIYFAYDREPIQLKHCFWWKKKKEELENKVSKGEKQVTKSKLHSRTPLCFCLKEYFPEAQKSGGGTKVVSCHPPHKVLRKSGFSKSEDPDEGNSSCMGNSFHHEHETNLLLIS